MYSLGIGRPLQTKDFNLWTFLPSLYKQHHAQEDQGEYGDEEVEIEEYEEMSESHQIHPAPAPSSSLPPANQHTPPSSKIAPLTSLTSQQKKNQKKDARHQEKHINHAQKNAHCPKTISIQRALTATPIPIQFDTTTLPATCQGWSGKRVSLTPRLQALWCNLQLLEHGLTVIEWDGKTCYAILDTEGWIIGLLGGTPKDFQGWMQGIHDTTHAIQKASSQMMFTPQQQSHRRGDFAAISTGISYRGSRQRVGNVAIHGAHNKQAMTELLANKGIGRIVGFSNSLFQLFFNKAYLHYRSTLKALVGANPLLRPNFPKSVFAAVTFNMGPASYSPPHTDDTNDAAGQCAITALGDFDPDQGGHLVLWNLGLIVHFPPGSTILIPSALVTHSNIPVQPGETRYLVIQYSAGALARWVYNGHQSDKSWCSHATPEQHHQRELDRQRRWKDTLASFTLWDDFVAGNWHGLKSYLSGDLSDLSDVEVGG